MRPLLSATAAVALIAAVAPRTAAAQDVVLPNVKIVVLDPKQSPAWGGAAIAKTLRKKLEAATGQSIAPAAYAKALKGLKVKGSAATEPDTVARAGKQAGADYVLVLTITKKGWLYTANAILINTTSGEQQMDFKSGYYKPKVEAADRGERIARVTVEKLQTLASGGGGAVAVAPPPPPRDDIPDPKPYPRDDQRVSNDRVDEPPPPPPERRSATADRVEDPPPARDDGATARNDPPPARGGGSSGGGSSGGGSSGGGLSSRASEPEARPTSRADRISEPRDEPTRDLIHATVQGGAGVLHTFDLDSSDGRRSRLSYQLDPLALISGEVEALIPVVSSGVFVRAAFSPVRFQVTVGKTTDEPGGSLLDLAFGLKLHLTLTGQGRDAIQLAPLAGLRVGLLGVADHPADLVLGSTSIAPFVGAELSLPFAGSFEGLVGFDFGLIVAYSETPAESKNGDFSGGIALGAGLGLRYWLTDALGVAFDGRFDLRSISLSGATLRQTPAGETITDASIGNRDLRFSVGVALRL